MKPSLTDMSTWANAGDIWVLVVGLVGLIAGVIWAYHDE